MQEINGMRGANVDQLRRLAQQFDQGAQRLDSNRLNVLSLLQSVIWEGPAAARFRYQWNSRHGHDIQRASEMLRESARQLRANADAQDQASAAGGNSGSGSSGLGAPIDLDKIDPRVPYDYLVNAISAIGTVGDVGDIAGAAKLPGVLTPIGMSFSAAAAVESASKGDWIGAVLNGASVATAPFPGLSLATTGFTTFVDATLPYNAESVDETYAKGVENIYGPDVNPNDLTPEQAQGMLNRYDGVWGFCNMISDRMDATADKIFPWNSGKK